MFDIKSVRKGSDTMARTKWTIETGKEEFKKDGYVLHAAD